MGYFSIRYHHLINPGGAQDTFQKLNTNLTRQLRYEVTGNNTHTVQSRTIQRALLPILIEQETRLWETFKNDTSYSQDYFGTRDPKQKPAIQRAQRLATRYMELALMQPDELIAITGLQDSLDCMACVLNHHCRGEVDYESDSERLRRSFSTSQTRNYTFANRLGEVTFPFVLVPSFVAKSIFSEGSLYQYAINVSDHPKHVVLDGFLENITKRPPIDIDGNDFLYELDFQ